MSVRPERGAELVHDVPDTIVTLLAFDVHNV
jgi:hypothetical protein